MQLIGRVLILALCLFGAYTLPSTLAHNDEVAVVPNGVYEILMAQMRASLIDTRALSPPESACADYYNNATQKISNQLVNQTNLCFENANKTSIANDKNVNVTINLVRSNLMDVSNMIANCSAYNDTNLFLNCTTATFDYNLLHLDAANSNAYKAKAQLVSNAAQVDIVRQACIDTAIGSAKVNLTIAANDYSTCLARIKYLRAASAIAYNQNLLN